MLAIDDRHIACMAAGDLWARRHKHQQRQIADTGYNFNLGRDYLNPLPSNQLTLFTNLKRNPGW